MGQIEALLTLLEHAPLQADEKKLIRCTLYRSYFDGVMAKNCKILEGDPAAELILSGYYDFLKTINVILLQRKSTILGKEVNLFTTNIDIFLEKAIERIGLECNDGFSGRFKPWFDRSNFQKSHSKRSLQYDNKSELPTVNLLKLHGSLTWQIEGPEKIVFSSDLSHVRSVETKHVTPDLLLQIGDGLTLDALIAQCQGRGVDATVEAFLNAYEEIPIVNPTKAKFRQTLINQTHYELLRIYSNELEKENTVLFVMGFSFADEHIREITLRAANSNPTLVIRIYAYDSKSRSEIRARFPDLNLRNNNVEVIGPLTDKDRRDVFQYDLPTINEKVFREILKSIIGGNSRVPANREAV